MKKQLSASRTENNCTRFSKDGEFRFGTQKYVESPERVENFVRPDMHMLIYVYTEIFDRKEKNSSRPEASKTSWGFPIKRSVA